MKTLLFFSLLFLLLSCGSSEPKAPSEGTGFYVGSDSGITFTTDSVSAIRRAIAESIGTHYDSVVFTGDAFVIERDSYISYEDAVLRYTGPLFGVRQGQASGSTQMFSFYRIDTSRYKTVSIYADATVPAMWLNALDSAIVQLNGVNHGIRYTRQRSSTGATTRVTTNNVTSSTIASAAYPSYYGQPGSKITINLYHNSLPESKKIFAITHELGHTIGFSHSNGTYGLLIEGTGSDAGSVMNSVVREWKGFSAGDSIAFRKVYP